eukprot:TRINITY_DN22094_c0_g1_i1.p1 TRINITY_DN22094_c0_g1~~TRINITY_DN22094_c0_g1_i1.p1  ORF type:complete len:320 (+),score=70.76 TRINITY_DN22094_c0_g1_i1:130-1089(+)
MARMDRTQSLCSAVNVDIPCATVRFERSEGPFEGAGKLVLESRKAPATKADIETVIDSLKTIALRGQEELSGLVAIYDLTCLPSMTVVPHIVGVVGPFSKEYSPILDKLFLSIAVVLQDSFWSAAARNAVNIILKIAPPKCPFLLTHRRDLAEDFVRTNLKAPEQKPAPAVAAAAEPAHRATASTSAADAAAATKDFRTRLLSIDGLDNCQELESVAPRLRVASVADLDQDKVPMAARHFSGNAYYRNVHFSIDEIEEEKLSKGVRRDALSPVEEYSSFDEESPYASHYAKFGSVPPVQDDDAIVCVLRIEKPTGCVLS